MSTFGDAFRALREVVLIHANVERLEQRTSDIANDVEGLAEGLTMLRDRVSRLEGIMEGIAISAGRNAGPRQIEEQ